MVPSGHEELGLLYMLNWERAQIDACRDTLKAMCAVSGRYVKPVSKGCGEGLRYEIGQVRACLAFILHVAELRPQSGPQRYARGTRPSRYTHRAVVLEYIGRRGTLLLHLMRAIQVLILDSHSMQPRKIECGAPLIE